VNVTLSPAQIKEEAETLKSKFIELTVNVKLEGVEGQSPLKPVTESTSPFNRSSVLKVVAAPDCIGEPFKL